MKKIIASIAAAGVLVAGAFVASAVTSSEASAQTDEALVATDDLQRPEPGSVLDDVLEGLVADGTLDEGQAEAVKDAMLAKRDEIKERRAERMKRRQDMRERIEALLEDGEITRDELDELDFGLPRSEDGPLAEALEDGKITQEEWDAIVEAKHMERKARWEQRRAAFAG